MSSEHLKVIIDTNLWISFLIGKQLDSLKPLLINRRIQPISDVKLKEGTLKRNNEPVKFSYNFFPTPENPFFDILTALEVR